MKKYLNYFYSQIKNIKTSYKNTSIWGKILLFTVLLILLITFFKQIEPSKKEGFEQQEKFVVKTGNDIYDNFYAEIYDYLVYSNLKDDYEIGQIVFNTTPTSESKILDIGCGTGHHVAALTSNGFNVVGVDISPSMIARAKESYPDCNFEVGDVANSTLFQANAFTHILCMYFTVYYIDKPTFFRNCFNWLMPGGHLIVHLVDGEHFDPILPSGNPLFLVSPQRYAKKRITSTKLTFTDFTYSSDFQFDAKDNKATFVEKFKNNSDGKIRKNEHELHLQPVQDILSLAQEFGFIVDKQIDLLHCQYEYQYLYVLLKPQ